MGYYIILMNLTEQGVKDVKNAPARVKATAEALEAAGGKLLHFFVTMGQYDYVAIAKGPSDEVALAQLLGLGAAGNVTTTTLKAFSLEQFKEVLKALG